MQSNWTTKNIAVGPKRPPNHPEYVAVLNASHICVTTDGKQKRLRESYRAEMKTFHSFLYLSPVLSKRVFKYTRVNARSVDRRVEEGSLSHDRHFCLNLRKLLRTIFIN